MQKLLKNSAAEQNIFFIFDYDKAVKTLLVTTKVNRSSYNMLVHEASMALQEAIAEFEGEGWTFSQMISLQTNDYQVFQICFKKE
ncbi:MAG: hypothetical protein ACM3UU_12270 [Ignavibacteriales bacterium]